MKRQLKPFTKGKFPQTKFNIMDCLVSYLSIILLSSIVKPPEYKQNTDLILSLFIPDWKFKFIISFHMLEIQNCLTTHQSICMPENSQETKFIF